MRWKMGGQVKKNRYPAELYWTNYQHRSKQRAHQLNELIKRDWMDCGGYFVFNFFFRNTSR